MRASIRRRATCAPHRQADRSRHYLSSPDHAPSLPDRAAKRESTQIG
jgi:hypothetical protein